LREKKAGPGTRGFNRGRGGGAQFGPANGQSPLSPMTSKVRGMALSATLQGLKQLIMGDKPPNGHGPKNGPLPTKEASSRGTSFPVPRDLATKRERKRSAKPGAPTPRGAAYARAYSLEVLCRHPRYQKARARGGGDVPRTQISESHEARPRLTRRQARISAQSRFHLGGDRTSGSAGDGG